VSWSVSCVIRNDDDDSVADRATREAHFGGRR
jgi:hypothetical protein